MDNYLVIGKSPVRKDGVEKVTGTAQYISDLKIPGMLHAKILRSPHPHALIKKIDTSRAKQLPGVRAVLTAEDTPKVKYGFYVNDDHVLADKARFTGDEIAVVAATSEEKAQAAVELIVVEYKELPAVFTFEDALAEGAPAVHDNMPGNIAARSFIERGDVDNAFDKADHVISGTYTTGAVNHVYLEPYAAVGRMNGSKVELWLPCQNPFAIRSQIAKALKMRVSDIIINQTLHIGGAFGGKLDSKIHVLCALLVINTRKPVRLVSTRQDEFESSCRVRVGTEVQIETAVTNDGIILGKKAKILGDNGAYSSLAPKIVTTNMVIRIDNLYRIPAVRTESQLIYTNKMPSGAFRGYGNPQMHFAVESNMDEISEFLGIDPIEFRLKNASRTGDKTIHGWDLKNCRYYECLEKVREVSKWREIKKNKIPYRGIGVAGQVHCSGNRGGVDYHGSEAHIRIHEDGKVQVTCAEVELGQGAKTVLAQIAAEEIGVPLSEVDVLGATTESAPYIFGAYSTRTTHIGGNAVLDAARNIKQKILTTAEEILQVNSEKLIIRNGEVVVNGDSSKNITIAEIAKKHLFRKNGEVLSAHGKWDPDGVQLGADKYGNISTGYPFAAHAAEVEVDPETGLVKVLNYYAVHDSGRIINRKLCEGQIEGGVLQGLGYALCEEVLFDKGKVLNGNMLDYKVPTVMDMPDIHSDFVEFDEPDGPFGAKGIGEPTLNPVAAAIANAIYDAAGARINSLPITPEKILKHLIDNYSGEI